MNMQKNMQQEYAEEYAKENEANMVRELFKNGVSFLSVKNSVKYLPEEKVKEIFEEVAGNQKK